MAQELVRYAVADAIAEITLDRAPVNALSMALIDALLAALAKARDDESVRAVIICSAHKVFCAGLDLDIIRGKRATETKGFLERLYFALNDIQYRMGKPTIAAPLGRECGRELCPCRQHGRLSGRAQRLRREAGAEIYRALTGVIEAINT